MSVADDVDIMDVHDGPSPASPGAGLGPVPGEFQSYEDLFRWPDIFLEQIGSACLEALEHLRAMFLQRGLAVVTDYSGMGTPEVCLGFIHDALQRRFLPGQQDLILQRASDKDVYCRLILQAHAGSLAPNCVFGDLQERCPEELFRQCQQMLLERRKACDEAVAQGASERDARRRIGRQFILDALNIMTSATRTVRAWCHRHGRACCAWPVSSSSALRMSISGITCVDWSALGKREQWLGSSSLAFLMWCREKLAAKESLMIVECTEEIDIELIAVIFDEYILTRLMVCPSDLGVPATRKRRYMIFIRKTDFAWGIETYSPAFFDRMLLSTLQPPALRRRKLWMRVQSKRLREEGFLPAMPKETHGEPSTSCQILPKKTSGRGRAKFARLWAWSAKRQLQLS